MPTQFRLLPPARTSPASEVFFLDRQKNPARGGVFDCEDTRVYLPPLELPPIPEPPLIPPLPPLMPEPLPLGPAAVPLLDGSAPLVPDWLPLTLPAPVPEPVPGLVPVWAKDAVARLAANAPTRARVSKVLFIIASKVAVWLLVGNSGLRALVPVMESSISVYGPKADRWSFAHFDGEWGLVSGAFAP